MTAMSIAMIRLFQQIGLQTVIADGPAMGSSMILATVAS